MEINKNKISPIAIVAEECRRIGALNLAQGAADFAYNKIFSEKLSLEECQKQISYTSPRGTLELREAICKYLEDVYFSTQINQDEICITPGGTGAVAATILATTTVGDEVLLHEPFWDYHHDLVQSLGRKPIIVSHKNNQFNCERALSVLTTPQTQVKAIILVSPGNPSGEIISHDYLKRLLDISEKKKLVIILDEVYSDYKWNHQSGLLYNHLYAKETSKLILCHSLSKSACLTGWRIGYAISSSKVINKITNCNGLLTACASAPIQKAASLSMLELSGLTLSYREIVEKSKNIIIEGFTEKGFKVIEPDGGFFFLSDVSSIGFSSGIELRKYLLNQCGIGVVEAEGFYENGGENMIRVCFAVSNEIAFRVKESIQKFRN